MKRLLLYSIHLGYAAVALLFVPGFAVAEWSLSLDIAGPNVTKIEFFITDTDSYKTTFIGSGASDFKVGTYNPGGQLKNVTVDAAWTAQQINPTYVLAQGDGIANGKGLSFDLFFSDQKNRLQDFKIEYIVYNGATALYGKSLAVKNGVFSRNDITDMNPSLIGIDRRTPSAVPIPPTAFLLGAGIFGLAALKKKIKT